MTTAAGPRRILCVGALTMDTIFRMNRLPSRPGKYLPIDAMEIAEGMASSAATSSARLGGDVALWGSLGDDAVGDRARASIAAEGVDCGPVRRVAGVPSGIAAVLVDGDGERIIVPYYHPNLWRDPVLPAGFAEGAFAAVMVDVRWPEAAAMALRAARQAGAFGIFDADVASTEVLEMLAPLASHIVASSPGAALLSGVDLPDVAAGSMARRFSAMVVVTAGERGCFWVERGGSGVRHTAAPMVDAVDTTAAGDVFHGAFALGLIEGLTGEALVRFASSAAAVKCTRFGGRLGAPTRAETEAMLARSYP